MSTQLQLPLNVTVNQTTGSDPIFEVKLHHEVFKEIDFIGGKGSTISLAMYEAAATLAKYESDTEEERMDKFLTTPHNRQEACKLAFKFGEATKWNSFSLMQIKKKKNKILGRELSEDDLITNLQNLIMFRFCVSKRDKDKITFKIVVKPIDLNFHLTEEIKTYQAIIRRLELQKEEIAKEIPQPTVAEIVARMDEVKLPPYDSVPEFKAMEEAYKVESDPQTNAEDPKING